MINVGEIIKTARKEKNLTLDEVTLELKISKSILKNIENNKVDKHYDIVFFIGHLRSYCDYLDLNSKEIINLFKIYNSIDKTQTSEKILKPNFQVKTFSFQRYIPISLILIIFSSFYILFVREGDSSKQYALIPDLPEAYIPIIEKTNINSIDDDKSIKKSIDSFSNESFNSSSAVASHKISLENIEDKITLKLLNPTWLQLRDNSNNIILSKLMDKNEEFSYNINLNYSITAGNAGNILVMINTEVRGKIGKFGEVVDSLVLDSNFNN
tara:strand:+ start:55 stop:861 length:807 start_codon:yes stop_codon:yes gene_type:complete